MELDDYFRENNKAALAFSGGADSAYLLWAGLSAGADIRPYYARSAFQPEFELRDAKRLCKELGIGLCVIDIDVLSVPELTANGSLRCYYCKRLMFSELAERAKHDGYTLLIDGTNASDAYDDRPGMRAKDELSVSSPLRLCGITKDRLRELSREAGLFTWDKPSYSCLATRIPSGESIERDKLKRIEKGESILFSMGFSDFRLRFSDGKALLYVCAEELEKANNIFEDINEKLKPYFSSAEIELRCR